MAEQFAKEPAFGLLLAEDQDRAATQFIRAMQTAWQIRGAPPVVQSLSAKTSTARLNSAPSTHTLALPNRTYLELFKSLGGLKSPAEITAAVKAAFDTSCGSLSPRDDLTLVCIQGALHADGSSLAGLSCKTCSRDSSNTPASSPPTNLAPPAHASSWIR